MTRRFNWRTVLIVGVLSLGALLMIIPYYWMVISSLKSPEELFAFPPLSRYQRSNRTESPAGGHWESWCQAFCSIRK